MTEIPVGYVQPCFRRLIVSIINDAAFGGTSRNNRSGETRRRAERAQLSKLRSRLSCVARCGHLRETCLHYATPLSA